MKKEVKAGRMKKRHFDREVTKRPFGSASSMGVGAAGAAIGFCNYILFLLGKLKNISEIYS